MIDIIQTSKNTKSYWRKQKSPVFGNKSLKNLVIVEISPEQRHQKVIGFGGAFTETACYNIMSASPQNIESIMRAYFTPEGLNYSLGRVVVNSCDFSLNSYTYVEEGDNNLTTFNIEHERKYVIPVIELASEVRNEKIRLVASPWSPPAYMKTNASMLQGGSLKPEYRPLWGRYLARYLKEMSAKNLLIEYLSVQNEPEAKQTWESCLYTGQEEASFIAEHLYPALLEQGLENIKILAWDHNRDHIVERAAAINDNETAKKVVWGLAFHWYVSNEHNNLTKVHDLYPDKHLLFTEGCVELNNHNKQHGQIGSWEHGETYGRNMINDFNNYCEGWIDWNLVVDEKGGPNHADNFCEAPIIYNQVTKEIILNPSYYYIGHFSKYVLPGAYRLQSKVSHSAKVLSVSFLNPSLDITTIIQNEGRTTTVALRLERQELSLRLPAHSITTVVMHDKQRG